MRLRGFLCVRCVCSPSTPCNLRPAPFTANCGHIRFIAVPSPSSQTEPLGRQMAEFPTEPRLAAMLLSSLKYKCSEEMLTIAACSSVESLFYTGRDSRKKARCGARARVHLVVRLSR